MAKKENYKMGKKLKIGIFLALIIALLPNVFSIGLGVSPAVLSYKNVLKGGYAQSSLYLTTDTDQNLSMYFEPGGNIKDWIRINDNNISNITVSRTNPKVIKVIIEPATDTANGEYRGTLRIVTDKLIDPQTGIGSSVKAAFMVNIVVEVTGDQMIVCTGGGVGVSDTEIGYPLPISSIIQNEGNVRISPQIFVDIWDKYQKEIVFSTSLPTESIRPTESLEVKKEVITELNEDQYWAQIKVPQCGIENTLTFNIVEKGGVSDRGDLLRIDSKVWAETDEIIPITAYFRNDGGRTVSARFKGEVLSGNKVVKVIDTDLLDAAPGEVIALQSFFRPKEEGQYLVKGKVYFNNKLTTEKGSVINVKTGEASTSASSKILWYALILITITILVMLIMIKKKKQRKHRIRSHR